MALSNDLISQFVKATNDDNAPQTEQTVYGTIKISDGKTYVQIDGSTMYTPISTTTDAEDGDRVTVMIKNHSAVVTGNITKPAATKSNLDKVEKDLGTKIDEFDIIVADKVNTDQLNAVKADITDLTAKEVEIRGKLTAAEGDIDDLEAENVTIKEQLTAHSGKFDEVDASFVNVSGQLNAANAKIDTLEATDADFRTLEADYGEFKNLTTDNFEAENARIDSLEAEKLDVNWANIDFVNIDQAAMKQFYSASGLIEYITTDGVTSTGYIIGVKIKGDLIEAGTLKAEQLVIRGTDGNYYQLNTDFSGLEFVEPVPEDAIHGSVIVAESITADKVSVGDLVAFGATIGGFNITGVSEDTPGAIYSGVKNSPHNATRGSYLDTDGQFAFGDSFSYVKYYKVLNEDGTDALDESGNPIYKLAISADSLVFGSRGRNVDDLADLADRIKMGTYTDPETGESKPSLELDEDASSEKLLLTNDTIIITDGESEETKITKDKISTGEIEQRGWVWGIRANGNYGLTRKGGG